jgi:hypothetical protein
MRVRNRTTRYVIAALTVLFIPTLCTVVEERFHRDLSLQEE